MASDPHFVFGHHGQHGFVAAFASSIPVHLGHRLLGREQFEPVRGKQGLFRLTEPERDGPRRTRQAVRDLRRHGYTVHADASLDPTASANRPRPARRRGLIEHRDPVHQAAAARSTQRGPAPTASGPAVRPVLAKPARALASPHTASGRGRSQ